MREAVTLPLSLEERSSLYDRLAKLGARVFQTAKDFHFIDFSDEEILAVAAEQSRYNYRLLYVLVELLATDYAQFNPFRIRDALHLHKTPQVWGVIREYVSKVGKNPGRDHFFAILVEGLKPASPQLFFNSLRTPRPERMEKIVLRTTKEF